MSFVGHLRRNESLEHPSALIFADRKIQKSFHFTRILFVYLRLETLQGVKNPQKKRIKGHTQPGSSIQRAYDNPIPNPSFDAQEPAVPAHRDRNFSCFWRFSWFAFFS